MFDIDLSFEDIIISSIEEKDLDLVKAWLLSQRSIGNSNEKYLNISELRERFIESYMSESEFFVKVKRGDKLLGILKGRIEFKQSNQVWIWCYIVENNSEREELGNKIACNLINYFIKGFGIYSFYTIGSADNDEVKEFWYNNGFKLIRRSEKFFDYQGERVDMLIFNKEES